MRSSSIFQNCVSITVKKVLFISRNLTTIPEGWAGLIKSNAYSALLSWNLCWPQTWERSKMSLNQNWWWHNVHIFPFYVAHSIKSRNKYKLGFCGHIWCSLTLSRILLYIMVYLWITFVHILMTCCFDSKCPQLGSQVCIFSHVLMRLAIWESIIFFNIDCSKCVQYYHENIIILFLMVSIDKQDILW